MITASSAASTGSRENGRVSTLPKRLLAFQDTTGRLRRRQEASGLVASWLEASRARSRLVARNLGLRLGSKGGWGGRIKLPPVE